MAGFEVGCGEIMFGVGDVAGVAAGVAAGVGELADATTAPFVSKATINAKEMKLFKYVRTECERESCAKRSLLPLLIVRRLLLQATINLFTGRADRKVLWVTRRNPLLAA